MAHISYSAMRDWDFCPYFHKLTRIDKVVESKGNEFTAFGKAIHKVGEDILLGNIVPKNVTFLNSFDDEVKELLGQPINEKLIQEMKVQGLEIIEFMKPALENYFSTQYQTVGAEIEIRHPLDKYQDYDFYGFIDGVVETPDGTTHIFDWKSCSWGWQAKKKTDPIIGYQLALYKHFYSESTGTDPEKIKTHFALLKRTAKKDRVEFFEVPVGKIKTKNALKLLDTALYNITNSRYIKKKTSCSNCQFSGTEYCK